MRRVACLIVASLGLIAPAWAQVPTAGNVFFGYSFENTSSSALNLDLSRPNLQGWQATLEGKVFPAFGIVADFTGNYGSQNYTIYPPGGPGPLTVNVTGHQYDVMFGPRFSVPIGNFRPFAEFEGGVGHISTNASGSDTSLAYAFGGGLDYRLMRMVAWRFEGDYLSTRFFSTSQQDVRLSTGIVIRF
ncbi:MAG TPA: outer membrane beta-barrel protein [Verrucomicrobiae bacterium]|nr:outer membrane beta-barrel protein [Verrucomicrobiae bacterium]